MTHDGFVSYTGIASLMIARIAADDVSVMPCSIDAVGVADSVAKRQCVMDVHEFTCSVAG